MATRRRLHLLIVALAILGATTHVAAQRSGRGRFGNVNLKVGQDAPELQLAPLTFDKDEKGEMVGTIGTKMVSLADFKGKAPVVIFSSSYT